MAERTLNPTGGPVTIGPVALRTPGLRGSVAIHRAATPGLRGAERATPALDAALANANVRSPYTVELTDTAEVEAGAGHTRSTTYGTPAIVLEAAAPEGLGQVVLAVDEAGMLTWHHPVDAANRPDRTRGAGTGVNTYVIPRAVPPGSADPAALGTRGLIGIGAKKLLKVLVFPLIDPIMGEIGEWSVRRWEQAKRPYRVRMFGPETYREPNPGGPPADGMPITLSAEEWARLDQGRALLFIHGTFSRADSGFGGFRPEDMQTLWDRYGGRVFAIDHFTLTDDPRQNVDRLLTGYIPDGVALDLDIVSHSRGGLVARVLAERQAELSLGSRTISVGSVVFTATPNGGTPLADPEHLGTYVDVVTNLLQWFPDNGVTETLEAVITVAKHAAQATATSLPGLMAMRPAGTFLTALNAGPATATRYRALASNFEPSTQGDGWRTFARDHLMDMIFGGTNDLVVPTEGVYAANNSGGFPIAEPFLFEPTAAIAHSGFFSNQRSATQIVDWLPG